MNANLTFGILALMTAVASQAAETPAQDMTLTLATPFAVPHTGSAIPC